MSSLNNSEKLGSAHRSLRNARNHFVTLETECEHYLKSEPLKHLIEVGKNPAHEVHKVIIKTPIPEIIEQAAFDLANNLRSALDQACYAIAKLSGTDGTKSHFPFGKTLDDVLKKKKGGGGSKNIPDEVFSLILEVKPYEVGNLILWELNNICNKGKHEIITPIAGMFKNMACLQHAKFERLVALAVPPKWDFERQEMVLATLGRNSAHTYEIRLYPFLAIGGDSAFRGSNALLVFAAMEKEVKSILTRLEEKILSLGL